MRISAHSRFLVRSASCLSRKCCTLPSALRGRPSTNTTSRGTLKRASCVPTVAHRCRRRSPPRPARQHHVGDRHLLPSRIGAADHGGLRDGRMLVQHALDLGRIDVLATGDDHVLLAVVDVEIAVGVARADVAGVVPAVAQRLARSPPHRPNIRRTRSARARRLRRRAVRDLAAVVVDDARLAQQPGQAGRVAARQVAAEAGIDRDRAGLGRAIDLQHRHAARREGSISGCGTWVEPVVTARRLERSVAAPARMLDHRLHGRRHQHGQCRPIVAPAPQRRVGRKARDAASRSRRPAAPAWSGC